MSIAEVNEFDGFPLGCCAGDLLVKTVDVACGISWHSFENLLDVVIEADRLVELGADFYGLRAEIFWGQDQLTQSSNKRFSV